MDDQLRSIAFGRRLQEKMSTRLVPFRWGTAYFDDEFPRRYGSNFLWVDGFPDVDAAALAGEADRLLGGAGFEHRGILVDPPELVERLRPGFLELGWSASEYQLMVLRHAPPERAGLPEARSVSHREALPLLEQHVREAPWFRDEASVRTLADYPGKLQRTVGALIFVAGIDGRPAASCELYLDGGQAQVESVQTLAEARGKGLGTAVVVAAIRAALERGAGWIHLYAERGDWPEEWYRRLGFETAGSFGEFSRYPNR